MKSSQQTGDAEQDAERREGDDFIRHKHMSTDGDKNFLANPHLTRRAHVCLLKACHRCFDHCDVFILLPWRDECHCHLTHPLGKKNPRYAQRHTNIPNYDSIVNTVTWWYLGKTFVHRFNIWQLNDAKQLPHNAIPTPPEVSSVFVPSILCQLDEWVLVDFFRTR